MLEVIHKGTNQVKKFKINMLDYKYELFKMEPNESITNIFTNFIDIMNNSKSLSTVQKYFLWLYFRFQRSKITF